MARVSNFYGITHKGEAKSILCTTEHAEAQKAYRETLENGGRYEGTDYRQVWIQTSTHPKESSMIFPAPAEREKESKRLAEKAADAKKKAADAKAKAKKVAEDAKKAPAAQAAAAQAEAKKAETKAKAAEKLANEAIGKAKALEIELEESHKALATAEKRAATAEETLAQVGVENPPTADDSADKTPPAQSTK